MLAFIRLTALPLPGTIFPVFFLLFVETTALAELTSTAPIIFVKSANLSCIKLID